MLSLFIYGIVFNFDYINMRIDNNNHSHAEYNLMETRLMQNIDVKPNLSNVLIDYIIENSGYTIHQYSVILCAFLVLSVLGITFNLIPSMILPLCTLYNLDYPTVEFISILFYLGNAVGAFLAGTASSIYKRKKVLVTSLLILNTLLILLSLFELSILGFSLIQFTMGIFTGLIAPLIINLLCEYLPVFLRAFFLSLMWLGYSSIQVFIIYSMINIMPELQPERLRKIYQCCFLYVLIASAVIVYLIKDSPRNLILEEKSEQAIEIIEQIKKQKLNDWDKLQIIYEVSMQEANLSVEPKINELFNSDYSRLTFTLMLIWFFTAMIVYGLNAIISISIKQHSRQILAVDLLRNHTRIVYFNMLSSFIAGVSSEIKLIGRIRTSLISIAFCVIACLAFSMDMLSLVTTLGAVNLTSNVCYYTIVIYTCEIYPTKLRDTAMGFLVGFGYLGGVVSQFLCLFLLSHSLLMPILLFMLVASTLVVLLGSLEIDTYGVFLDLPHFGD